jgi:hypothetical protein
MASPLISSNRDGNGGPFQMLPNVIQIAITTYLVGPIAGISPSSSIPPDQLNKGIVKWYGASCRAQYRDASTGQWSDPPWLSNDSRGKGTRTWPGQLPDDMTIRCLILSRRVCQQWRIKPLTYLDLDLISHRASLAIWPFVTLPSSSSCSPAAEIKRPLTNGSSSSSSSSNVVTPLTWPHLYAQRLRRQLPSYGTYTHIYIYT